MASQSCAILLLFVAIAAFPAVYRCNRYTTWYVWGINKGDMQMTNLNSVGYAIADKTGEAIWGIGATVDEAWAMVVDGAGHFEDAHGNTIDPDVAFERHFRVYGATAALLAQVNDKGGALVWHVADGVACTDEEFSALYDLEKDVE